ncbi:sulfotransferase family protein [Pseudooceanicola nitratireducens]|nr:sulfotransferase family protein [Pseudooceanicola nitratireducens]
MQVINLGLPKSGTTTLARALRRAGLHTADHRIKADQSQRPELAEAFVADLIYDGYYRTGDALARLDEFEALSEISVLRERHPAWPQMDHGVLMAIRAAHPQVKFVASWRDPQDLSNSMLNWTSMVARMQKAALPGLPVGYGEEEADRIRWIEAHYAFLEAIFAGDPNFLILDVAAPNAREQLEAFTGRDMPWWGQANRNLKKADG